MVRRVVLYVFVFFASVAANVCYGQSSVVYFKFNSAELAPETRSTLDDFLRKGRLQKIAIFGHTDQVGSEAYNMWLSLLRARAVQAYLLSRRLPANHISVVRGFGTQRLISGNNDSLSRQINRRVVLLNNHTPSAEDSTAAAWQATLTSKPDSPERTLEVVHSLRPATAPPVTPLAPKPVVKQQRSEKLIDDLKDNKTKKGEHIVLKNLNFYAGSHELLPATLPALIDLVETMQKIPTLEVEIQGHVCCQEGTTDALDNATGELNLSVNRAKAVYDFLLDRGINPKRLAYKGLAHQFPLIADETSEEDRVANRRVEIKIIKL